MSGFAIWIGTREYLVQSVFFTPMSITSLDSLSVQESYTIPILDNPVYFDYTKCAITNSTLSIVDRERENVFCMERSRHDIHRL